MPSITIRSFAELLNLPAHAQAKILTEQKYPKQGPQSFKTPYYQQALTGIRAFYKAGGDPVQLALAKSRIEQFTQESKRDNNLRIIDSFVQSDLPERNIEIGGVKRLTFNVQDVGLRFSPDLSGTEGEAYRYILLHYRSQPLDAELAKTTLDLVHWGLEHGGTPVSTKHLEYVDLYTGKTYSIGKRRLSTISAAVQSLKIISTLWPSL